MILRLIDVSHRFARRWVLLRLNLEVAAGRTVLLTGDNGAGKTTLLRLLATALRPSRGALELFGQPARAAAEALRPRLRLMTHHHYLYEALSAAENLALVAQLSPPLAAAPSAAQALQRVGLGGTGALPVATFSAGMKRRLALARLLMGHPELALLDEPFAALDPDGVALMEEVIGALAARGATVLMSTHDIARGRALSDWHVHLAGGGIAHAGPLSA